MSLHLRIPYFSIFTIYENHSEYPVAHPIYGLCFRNPRLAAGFVSYYNDNCGTNRYWFDGIWQISILAIWEPDGQPQRLGREAKRALEDLLNSYYDTVSSSWDFAGDHRTLPGVRLDTFYSWHFRRYCRIEITGNVFESSKQEMCGGGRTLINVLICRCANMPMCESSLVVYIR